MPNYVTHRLTVKGNQVPRAIIAQSNTFQIRHVPVRTAVHQTRPIRHPIEAVHPQRTSSIQISIIDTIIQLIAIPINPAE